MLCLRVRDGRIAEAKFQTYGCGPTITAASMLTEMIVGRTVVECREVTAERTPNGQTPKGHAAQGRSWSLAATSLTTVRSPGIPP